MNLTDWFIASMFVILIWSIYFWYEPIATNTENPRIIAGTSIRNDWGGDYFGSFIHCNQDTHYLEWHNLSTNQTESYWVGGCRT